jgi:hypothetical protein
MVAEEQETGHEVRRALDNQRFGLSCEHHRAGRAFRPQERTPKGYVKTAESSNKRRQVFCGTCGTQLWACAVEEPQSYTLRAGTIAQRAAFWPRRQIWRRSALGWVDELAKVPASEKG